MNYSKLKFSTLQWILSDIEDDRYETSEMKTLMPLPKIISDQIILLNARHFSSIRLNKRIMYVQSKAQNFD